MNLKEPVEVTTRYVTTVDELPDAWAFVMARLDSVGPDPSVTIKPVREVGGSKPVRRFEVVVAGTVEEDPYSEEKK